MGCLPFPSLPFPSLPFLRPSLPSSVPPFLPSFLPSFLPPVLSASVPPSPSPSIRRGVANPPTEGERWWKCDFSVGVRVWVKTHTPLGTRRQCDNGAVTDLHALFAGLSREPDFDAAELEAFDATDELLLEAASE